jgi:hypothetical protein
VTNNNIKNVDKDKKLIKRNKNGSEAIYSKEYTWTKNEINKTTKHIVMLKKSNKKNQFILTISKFIHENNIQ